MPEVFTLKGRLWHKIINFKKLAQNSDKIIVPSKSTKQDVIDLLNISEEKIKVIHYGLDKRFSQIDDEYLRERV